MIILFIEIILWFLNNNNVIILYEGILNTDILFADILTDEDGSLKVNTKNISKVDVNDKSLNIPSVEIDRIDYRNYINLNNICLRSKISLVSNDDICNMICTKKINKGGKCINNLCKCE